MTIHLNGPNQPQAASASELKQRDDQRKAFARARRHSLLVRSLKVCLPLCAVGAMSLYGIYAEWRISFGGGEASMENVQLSSDKLTMTNPKLEGVTEDRAQYVVASESATQLVKDPHLVLLEKINANLTPLDGNWSKLTANKGRFNTKSEELALNGNIRIFTRDGLNGRLSQANVLFKKQTIKSSKPVLIEMLNGRISAGTMYLRAKEQRVTFEGQVRVHLKKRPPARESAKAAGKKT